MGQVLASWTGLDYAIAVIVFLSLLFGLMRGFVKEIISVIAWIAAFFAALKFAPDVDQLLQSAITNVIARYIVSVVLIFLVVVLAGCLFSKLIRALLKVTGFCFFDRLLGLIFGAIRGCLFVVILLVIVQATPSQSAAWVKKSALAPHFQPAVTQAATYLPKEIIDFMRKTFNTEVIEE